MGRRLADVDDEVLIAFLDSLLRTSAGREERAMLDALASALAVSGIISDPTAAPASWINEIQRPRSTPPPDAITAHQPHGGVPPVPPAPTVPSPAATTDPGEHVGPRAEPPPRVTVPLENLFSVDDHYDDPDFDLGWDDAPVPAPAVAVAPQLTALEDLFTAAPVAEVSSVPQGTPPRADESQATALVDLWPDEQLGNPAPSGDSWSPSPVRANTQTRQGPAAPPAAPPPALFGSVVRPELFPSSPRTSRSKTAAKKRATRIQAEAPADAAVDTLSTFTGAPRDGLDDVLRQALLAAASIPRPVFTRDLVAIAGTPEVVALWEDECRAHPDVTQVRFISPKARHRARGSLIIPDDSVRSAPRRGYDDWWAQAINRYYGARLYELGVLLHRIGDEIVSTRFGEHTAVLRLNSSRGLVGIVVAMNDRLEPGEPARQELASALSELFTERLTLAAVLMSAGEERDLTRLVEATLGLAGEHGWNPAFPVVSARSWEYADDRGSTARVILGS